MNRKLLLLFLIFLCPGIQPWSMADDFKLNSRRISVQDGLSGNTINELAQDSVGYIWMATNNGLSRYDGYSAVNYSQLSPDPSRHMEARIGRIYHDPVGLLWLSTATYTNACYDLNSNRFVDWTGMGDSFRQLNKLLPTTSRGMFFYGYSFGVRRSQYRDGHFIVTDYTRENGALPSNEVLMLLEDDAHQVWMPTDRGVARLGADDRLSTVLPGVRIIAAATRRGLTCFLTASGEVFLFDKAGQRRLPSMPATLGIPKKVNTSFIWQGRWMLFTPEVAYSVDLDSGRWGVESGETHVQDGLNQGECAGFHFISNQSGRLWVYPETGPVRVLDLLPNARFTVNRGRKFHIVDSDGRLFIATYGNGLFVWNPRTDELRHFTAQQPNAIISTNYLLYAIRDRQGCIWLGSEATGAYCLSVMTVSTASNYLLPEPQRQGDWANAVSSVAEQSDGTILIGTREGGVYTYDRKAGSMARLATRMANVNALFTDRNQHLWTGTSGKGLFLDGQQYQRSDTLYHLPEDKVIDFCQDGMGRVWIATRDGGLLMTIPQEGRPLLFSQFLSNGMNESRIKDLELAPDGKLWIATNNGIYLLDTRQKDVSERSFKSFNTANGQFPYAEIFSLHCAGDSSLWVGAANSGAVKCRLDAGGTLSLQERITTREGLASNNVYSFVEDGYGYLWMGTEDGISRINMRNNIVNTYHPSPVLQGNVATENSACRTHDGLLLFGTNHGLVTIMPNDGHRQGTRQLSARITDLRINGLSVYDLQSDPMSLSHDQNSLSFLFSNFNYDNTQSSLYQFYLEGADHDWLPMTSVNHADYSSLSPGTYHFHLRSLGDGNEWLPETVFSVRIRQPWYGSWWAWLVYVLLAVLMGWYVWSNWKEKFDLHQQMKLQRQLMDFRMQLFTSVTHEFRTPLAIIKGAVDKLSSPDKQAVQTAQRGVNRMLKLVNLFMEFRKVSTGNMRLSVSEGDIVGFVKDIYQDFWPIARQKDIQTTFTPFEKSHTVFFDRRIVETVVYNLLSNAVKYTPERGSVSLRIKNAETLLIEVEDSGPGISPERQRAMFEPFMKGLASQGGMGIGLYTAREMARTHHGDLSYAAASPSGGALFSFTLPGKGYGYAEDEQDHAPQPATVSTQPTGEADEIIRQMQPEALNDLTVAVIEDDPDMMEQLRSELGVYFHTDCYMNGRAGFEGVSQRRPSLLVCDVMLPDMNGYDIVSQLKQQPATQGLPIIMLTALDDETHQLKAYKAGADDYMVKPCNFRLLVARAMQLIKWSVLPSPSEGQKEVLMMSQADKVFRDKLAMLVAQNLGNPDFSVDRLAEMMSMGRTKFYGKVKEFTGLSPNKYLMQERMQRAAELLADGELNVSEVSYRVGIQDPSYFNRCFKAHFGVAPSKYVKPAGD